MILRVDDVSANTDLRALRLMVRHFVNTFEGSVLLGVTIFARDNDEGSVYPEAPFKDMPIEEFYDCDAVFGCHEMNSDKITICSHGLYHVDHSKLSFDAQVMSILGSCRLLDSNIFIPPFNRWNEDTEDVCNKYGIKLIKSGEDGWLSLEHEPFDQSHDLWYFHPWRFSYKEFKKCIDSGVVKDAD